MSATSSFKPPSKSDSNDILNELIGQTFEGTVSNIKENGVLVTLPSGSTCFVIDPNYKSQKSSYTIGKKFISSFLIIKRFQLERILIIQNSMASSLYQSQVLCRL